MDKFKEPIVSKEFLDYVIPNILNGIIDGWQNGGDIDPKIIDKLKNLLEIGKQKAFDEYITNLEDFTVIIHGDLWSNNIMFGYNELGNVNDAKIVS